MRRRSLVLGVVALGAYLGVLALTTGLRSDHVRPLYDGFAPSPSYQWVDPPAFFASGNVTPKPVSATIKLGRNGSEAAGIGTPDGQFVINLARGAIAPSAGAGAVRAKITPVAPGTLAKVPGGLRANGNAYRLQLTYTTGKRVTRLRVPGTLVMEIPELGNDLFHAADRSRWARIDSRTVPPRQLSLTAAFEDPGYYMGATNLPELVAPSSESDHSLLIGIVVASLTVVVLGVAFLVVRRRRRRGAARREQSVTTVPADETGGARGT